MSEKSIAEKLKIKGYSKENLWDKSERMAKKIVEVAPLPEDLTPEEYITMGCAAALATLLAEL